MAGSADIHSFAVALQFFLLRFLLQRAHAPADERLGALLLAQSLFAGLARGQADVEANGHDGGTKHPLDGGRGEAPRHVSLRETHKM